MEAAAHRRQFGSTARKPIRQNRSLSAFVLSGGPRRGACKPAASLSSPQSAFCRLDLGFFSPVLFLLHHAGWGKLETFSEQEEKKFSHKPPPPLCLDSLTGRPFWSSAERNYYFWTRLLLFLFWFSLLRLLPGDRRGTLVAGGGEQGGRAIAFLHTALQIPDILSHLTPTGAS